MLAALEHRGPGLADGGIERVDAPAVGTRLLFHEVERMRAVVADHLQRVRGVIGDQFVLEAARLVRQQLGRAADEHGRVPGVDFGDRRQGMLVHACGQGLLDRVGHVLRSFACEGEGDASTLSQPGGTGDDWRLHLAYDLLAGRMHQVGVMDRRGGEHLARYQWHAGEVIVADRGYGYRRSVATAVCQQADIVVRIHPATLWPPNGKLVPVTVSGTITDADSGVDANRVTYAVKDEYRLVQPRRPITLGENGSYSFRILLQASRKGNDKDGRQYIVTISALDNAGNQGSDATGVTVPHDQGHR